MAKKKFSIFLLLIIFITTLSGCYVGPGTTDYSYDLCENYMLYKSSAHEIRVVPKNGWDNSTPIINTQVLEIAWNEQFIIATQKDTGDNGKPKSNKINYWILDAKTPQIYGPFNKTDFNNKRKSLNISDSLILKPVESYKK